MLTQEATQLTLGSTLSIENPRPRGFPGFPFCLGGFRPPSGAVKSRRAKLEEQKMLAFGRGFFCSLCRPKGCAPLGTPGRGCPLHRTPYSAFRRPCREPFAEGQGCRGRAPPTPCRQAWVAPVASRGRVLAPAGLRAAPTLDPPSTRKTRHRPAQGLEGHCRSGWGSRLAQRRPRSGLALTPRNDPNARAGGWGCFSPSRLPRGERPPEAAGGALAFDFCF